MSSSSGSESSTNEEFEISGSLDSDSDSESDLNTPDMSELRCACGLPARRRISRTPGNHMRPFFNCPKEIGDQCRFFQWEDELDGADSQHFGASNNSRCSKCRSLQRRISRIRYEMSDERADWRRKKMELESQIASLKSELDIIKNRIKLANDTELMPPFDKFSLSDNEDVI